MELNVAGVNTELEKKNYETSFKLQGSANKNKYYKNLQTIIELGTIILIHVKGYEMFTEFENSKMNIKDFLELMIKFHQTKILIVSYFACTLMSYRQKIC